MPFTAPAAACCLRGGYASEPSDGTVNTGDFTMTMMERFARADSRVSYRLPFPDYPSNARSFVHLDAKLLPYWHALFDVCPRLLKLDPPDGLGSEDERFP